MMVVIDGYNSSVPPTPAFDTFLHSGRNNWMVKVCPSITQGDGEIPEPVQVLQTSPLWP